MHKYYVSTLLKAFRSKRPCDDIQQEELLRKELTANTAFKPLREFFKGSLQAFISYMVCRNIGLHSYFDYFQACQELGLDMSLERNRFPHDFKHWHDIRCDEYASKKAKFDEERRKAFCEQFAHVAEKYTTLQINNNGGFVCLIAKSPAELIKEGEVLHHCVGGMGYDQKFAREETLIFFIRMDSDLKTPFVTVEYSPSKKSVLQCYAEHNTKPNDNVLNFIHQQWLPYANKQLKKIAA